MDDELQQLEAELKQLRPAAPSRELIARVERELVAGTASVPARGEYPGQRPALRRLAHVHWLWAAVLPAAAAIVIGLTLFSRPRPDHAGSSPVAGGTTSGHAAARTPLKPIAAENVLISSSDEGLVMLGDGTPARRERLQFVDTITWKNPQTNASLTWRIPREEVRVVPVSFQ